MNENPVECPCCKATTTRQLPNLLFIAGMPACGKTTFGGYLETLGYEHRNLEKINPPDFLKKVIDDLWHDRSVRADLSGLLGEPGTIEKMVITWGFPPGRHCMRLVNMLVDVWGFQPWWFYGDLEVSRTVYNHRSQNEEAYEIQMQRIGAGWPDMVETFMPHFKKTLERDGTRKSSAQIAFEMAF